MLRADSDRTYELSCLMSTAEEMELMEEMAGLSVVRRTARAVTPSLTAYYFHPQLLLTSLARSNLLSFF